MSPLQKSLFAFISLLAFATLVACGGGGGGTPISDAEFNTKAIEFVKNKSKELNVELAMVKTTTDQRNFVVVYNPQSAKYQVYNVINDNNVVVGIDYGTGHTGFVGIGQGEEVFRNGEKYFLTSVDVETTFDPFKNAFVTSTYFYSVSFEETSSSPKDLESLYAQSEDIIIGQTAENVRAAFGLSEERSVDVARLMTQLNQYKNKSMTLSELNMFSKELLNVTYGDLKKAAQNPQAASTEILIQRAARANEISNEHMKALIQELF